MKVEEKVDKIDERLRKIEHTISAIKVALVILGVSATAIQAWVFWVISNVNKAKTITDKIEIVAEQKIEEIKNTSKNIVLEQYKNNPPFIIRTEHITIATSGGNKGKFKISDEIDYISPIDDTQKHIRHVNVPEGYKLTQVWAIPILGKRWYYKFDTLVIVPESEKSIKIEVGALKHNYLDQIEESQIRLALTYILELK